MPNSMIDKFTQWLLKAGADEVMRLENTWRAVQFPFKVKVFYSEANQELGQKICNELGVVPGKVLASSWANHDVRVQLLESVKGCHCFVVGSYHEDSDKRHMELKALIATCKESGAEKVIAVIPFLGYMKQEKKKQGREAILVKIICREICAAGADHVVVIDLHADAIEGFFDNVPVDHLHVLKIIIDELKKDTGFDSSKLTGVSPDAGGVPRVRKFINVLKGLLAVIFKYRPSPETADTTAFLGTVDGRTAFILDDLIQGVTTFIECVIKLIEEGALTIYGGVIHGDWCGDAIRNMILLMKSGAVNTFYTTDTTPLPPELRKLPNIKVISVAPLLALVIKGIYMGTSLSPLYVLNGQDQEEKPKTESVDIRLKRAMKEFRGVDIDIDEILKEAA